MKKVMLVIAMVLGVMLASNGPAFAGPGDGIEPMRMMEVGSGHSTILR